MATLTENIGNISTAIQLALSPVFLLTAIAGMLNVMAGRLSRIIDRGRALTEGRKGIDNASQAEIHAELKYLERRRHFASIAITACTIAALLTCMVVGALFLESMINAPLKWVIGTLFTASTLAMVIGLTFFVREVHLATRTIRIPVIHTKP